MAALLVALVSLAGRYGYHRDELYFRMLPPAAGYVDQPPFMPWLARLMVQLGDELWVLRLPAVVLAVGSVVVLALLATEVGGGALAQGLAAWGAAFATMTLSFGHLLLTATVDLVVWPLVILFVVRAVLRRQERWWWLAGAVVGLSTYNKWLITLLVVSLVGGLLVAGPRRVLVSRGVLGGAGIAVLLALPNVLWQLRHGLPQLDMGQALSDSNAGEVRVSAVPMLLVMVGPLLVPFIVAGLVRLLHGREWRSLRFLAVALVIVVVLTLAGGSQFYYPYGLLVAVYALGCVPVAEFAQRSRLRRTVVIAAVALHVATNVVISLPVLPVGVLARTFIPSINSGVADQIGWPTYVGQVDRAIDRALVDDPGVVVLTSNYGEAGALARFSRHPQVPVVSGLNALWDLGGPPPTTKTLVTVGPEPERLVTEGAFERCVLVDRLASGLGLDNEEEEVPVAVCTGPRRPWDELWPTFRHLG
jgi:4-amino-4-deoxy-L-arabinose transferase-like glycosyltransferase